MKKISVVIPNFNGDGFLIECLKSVYKQKSNLFDLEVILVDNASVDNSHHEAQKQFSHLAIIQFPVNNGYATAVNAGAAKATGDYIAILNNDIQLSPDALSELIRPFDDKTIGIVGGKMVDTHDHFSLPGFKINPYLGFKIEGASQPDTPQTVDWISGAAMLVKKEVFRAVGFFDEHYFFYFEDTDFCLRAKKMGFKLFYQPSAKIIHLGGLSSQRVDQNELNTHWYRGKFRCILKNGTLLQKITSLGIQLMVFPYKVIIRHDGTGTAQIKGFLWSVKRYGQS